MVPAHQAGSLLFPPSINAEPGGKTKPASFFFFFPVMHASNLSVSVLFMQKTREQRRRQRPGAA